MPLKKSFLSISLTMILVGQGWGDQFFHFTNTEVVVNDGATTLPFSHSDLVTEYLIAAIKAMPYEYQLTPQVQITIVSISASVSGVKFKNQTTNYSFVLWQETDGAHLKVYDQSDNMIKKIDLPLPVDPSEKQVFDYLAGTIIKWVINTNEMSNAVIRNFPATTDLELQHNF
jgi:hypothetical protein